MTWRDEVLKHFAEPLPAVMIISDPDRLLQEKKILDQLLEKNLEIIAFEDPIRFRYLFESAYRDRLGKGNFCLVVHVTEESVHHVPYFLYQHGEMVELRLADLFPRLNLPVIKQLTYEQLDVLDPVYGQVQGTLSFADTCDFLLRKLFKGSGYEEIETKNDLMEFLFRKYVEEIIYPDALVTFLVKRLKERPALSKLPLTELFSSGSCFYQYVQKEWEQLVESKSKDPQFVKETAPDNPYSYFYLPGVQAVLDNLFLEGKLTRLSGINARFLPKWMQVGVASKTDSRQKEEQLAYFTGKLKALLQEKLTYKNWLNIARVYGEWKHVSLALGSAVDKNPGSQTKQLEKQIDDRFQEWMCSQYQSMIRLPYVPFPVMVHHIPHYLQMKKKKQKVALIVLDGMSFVQWAQIKQPLSVRYQLEERGVFAWVPTITSVSRQAIFSGEPPFYFSDTLFTTQREETRWKSFWENQRVSRLHVTFEKGLGQGKYDRAQITALKKPIVLRAGLVIDIIDQLMHGAIQGMPGMYEELSLWLKNRYLEQLLDDLLQSGFDVYITSDHGNKESIGIGKISEGVLAKTRGERVRIYEKKLLRDRASEQFPSIGWNDVALPENCHVLLAKNDQAFIIKDQIVISHGGISLEEVIVPFVRVAWKKNDEQ